MEYINNPYFLLALTFVIYGSAQIIQQRTHFSLFSPILVTIALIIVFLTAYDIPYDTYNQYGKYIEFWLKPAVVALGVPLYKQLSTRMKQYGAMRAVGMDERQMTKMIACEAFTYAVLGCVVGCAIGLPLSKSLYDFLIAGHFPSAVWQFPIISLGVILLFVSIAAIAAVYAPAKRIRNMSITATINEL